jgi:hypothetical protein
MHIELQKSKNTNISWFRRAPLFLATNEAPLNIVK